MPNVIPGAVFSVTRRCGPYEPIHYAGASGDFNPIHIDDAFAVGAGLPGKILQGLCTLSWMVEAAVEFADGAGRIAGVRARFHRPVLVGDEVTFHGQVGSINDGRLPIAFTVTNQRGEDVLRSASVDLHDGPLALPPPPSEGARYGPFRYVVGTEKVREFAQAIHGAPPSRIYPSAIAGLPARYAGPDEHLVPPPTFAVNLAIQPFLAATMDPALAVDFSRVVHGEQAFTFVRPPRAGELLVTTGVLVRDFEKGGNRLVVVETVTLDGNGEDVVRATWTAVVRR